MLLMTAIAVEIQLRRSYEQAKDSGKAFAVRSLQEANAKVVQPVYRVLVTTINAYDEAHKKDVPCDRSIMCLREFKRHRSGCPMSRNYVGDPCPSGAHFSCKEVH